MEFVVSRTSGRSTEQPCEGANCFRNKAYKEIEIYDTYRE